MTLKENLRRLKTIFCVERNAENMQIRNANKNVLKSFKNIHQGKRCFVIGNGPSLTPADLNLIKDEITFASNRIFYIFDKVLWRPTYYCAQDADVFKDISSNVIKIASQVKACFFASYCKKFLDSRDADAESIHYYFARLISAHKKRKFSKDISSYVDGGGTITYAAIQLAVYMGIKEIYLIGVDHNYSVTSFSNGQISEEDVKKNYFAGMPTTLKMTRPNTDNSTISFLAAKEFCDKHGVQIYNATRGGKLEVFPRRSIDDLF